MSSLVILYILGYVIGQRKKQDVNRAFVFLLLDFFAMSMLEFIVRLDWSRGFMDYRLFRAIGLFAAVTGFLLLNFVVAIAGKKRGIGFYLSAAVALAGCVFVLLPGIRIAGLSPGNAILPTSWFSVLVVLFILPPEVYAAFVAVSAYRRTSDESTRRNYRFLFAGAIVSGGIFFPVKVFFPSHFQWYVGDECASGAIAVFALILFRAISKHKFLSFDREKELARARQIESLGFLAGGIAHDFNNLLTGILSAFSLIKTIYKGADPAVIEMADQGIKASQQAAKLTRQLLTFAKGGDPVLEPVDMTSLITDTAEFVLHGSSCALTVSMPAEANGILADQGQLAQVFHNLAMNARQAMPGGGSVTITGRRRTISGEHIPPVAAGEYIEISFADSGEGIERTVIDRIFEPYFTTKPGGSGLGLTTAYSILRKHKGHITVNSEKGRGTTFTMLLPMVSGTVSQGPAPREPTSPARAGRILVVDDEEVVRKSLEKILSLFGFTTESARDADEALRLFCARRDAGNDYSCCILDLTMPGDINGKDLGKALLAKDPRLKIIISSGYHDDAVMARFSDYGFAGAIPKPFSVEELRSLMDSVLPG